MNEQGLKQGREEAAKKKIVEKLLMMSWASSTARIPGEVIRHHFTEEEREVIAKLTDKDFYHRNGGWTAEAAARLVTPRRFDK